MKTFEEECFKIILECWEDEQGSHIAAQRVTKLVLGGISYCIRADHPILARPDKVVTSWNDVEAYKRELQLAGYENIIVEPILKCCTSNNTQSKLCSICGGKGMSVVWNFCPECGSRLPL